MADHTRLHEKTAPPQGGLGEGDALARCQAQVQALARQQELLAYGISHDLRAPLRAIDNFSALLQRQSGDHLDAAAQGHLQRIRDAAARMGALVESLLEFSRVERAELAEGPVDLSLLAELSLAELRDDEPARTPEAHIAPGLVAKGDEAQLRVLVRQVLRNAWCFSPGDPRIEMSGERDGETLRVAIRDYGRGFDMRYASKLFEPFQRLHGADEGSGSGLGLATAHRIVERHGGRLWAHSEPGAGSTFFMELPAAAPPHNGPDA